MTDHAGIVKQYLRESSEGCITTQNELSHAFAALDALVAERDVLQHIIDCADTPLMRDVLAQRDEALNQVANMTQSVQVIQNDRAKLIEQSIAAEAEVARLREARRKIRDIASVGHGIKEGEIASLGSRQWADAIALAALAKEDTAS